MAKLWKFFGGEPFLTNPNLFILNRRKKRKAAKMRRRDSSGRFVKAVRKRRAVSASTSTRRRKKAVSRRRHVLKFSGPAIMNRTRKRYRRNPVNPVNPRRRARHYRRNPGFREVFSAPMIRTVGYTALGAIATPFLEGVLMPILPSMITGNKIGSYAIKIGSAVGISFAAQMVLGREAAKNVLVGGIVYSAMSIIQDTFPQILGAPANQIPPAASRYLNSQKLLGGYPGMRAYETGMTTGIPDRLDPAARF